MTEIWTNMELKRKHDEWDKAFDKLEKDMDAAMAIWIKNRKCKCKLETGFKGEKFAICKHWDREMTKVFSKRVDETWQMSIDMMGLQFEEMKKFVGKR